MSLRLLAEEPRRHYLLRGLPDADELHRWAAASVDESLDLSARQMAASMLAEAAVRATERLTAVATASDMAESYISAHEAQRKSNPGGRNV